MSEALKVDSSPEKDLKADAEEMIAGAIRLAKSARHKGARVHDIKQLSLIEELPYGISDQDRHDAIATSAEFYRRLLNPETIQMQTKKDSALNDDIVTGQHFADPDVQLSYTVRRARHSSWDMDFFGELEVKVRPPKRLPLLRLIRQ